MPKPWLIYALGGGWGHLMRGLSLARLIARERPTHLLVNSTYANRVRWDEQNLVLRCGGTELALTRAWVQGIFRERDWGALIVDTFPRGLGGELVEVLESLHAGDPSHRQRCVFIHRDLNPDYVSAKQLNSFVDRHYGLVLVPGDREAISLDLGCPPQRTPPWRIRNAAELPSPITLRTRLNLPNAPLVLVCATGNAEEQHHFGQLTADLAAHLTQLTQFSGVALRCLAPTCPPDCPRELWLSHWPGLECLPLATVVVGAAGYNLVQECEAVGVPLVTFALRRRYDRQWLRIQRFTQEIKADSKTPLKMKLVRNHHEAIAAVLTQLQRELNRGAHPTSDRESSCFALPAKVADYSNGAAIALEKISQQVQPENLA